MFFVCAHPGGGKIIETEIRSMVFRAEMGVNLKKSDGTLGVIEIVYN